MLISRIRFVIAGVLAVIALVAVGRSFQEQHTFTRLSDQHFGAQTTSP